MCNACVFLAVLPQTPDAEVIYLQRDGRQATEGFFLDTVEVRGPQSFESWEFAMITTPVSGDPGATLSEAQHRTETPRPALIAPGSCR